MISLRNKPYRPPPRSEPVRAPPVRMVKRPRGTPKKLTETQVESIRALAKERVSFRTLGRMFNISHVAAWKAARRVRWSDTQ